MTDDESPDVPPRLDWATLFFRPLVICGMMTCVAAAVVMAVEAIVPTWRGEYLVVMAGLATLETLIVERQMRLRGEFYTDRLRTRLVELASILVLLKAASYAQRGWAALARDVQLLPYRPLSFFDADFLIGAATLALLWWMALDIARLLIELESSLLRAQDQEAARNELKSRFTFGAVVVLFAVATQGLGRVENQLGMRVAQVGTLALIPSLYFGLGLLLFGQARLALLQSSWERDNIPVTPGLARRWATWGMMLVGAVIAVALIMPGGKNIAGLYVFVWLLWLLGTIGQLITGLLLLAFTALLSPCMWLFRMQQPDALSQSPLTAIEPPPAPAEARILLPVQVAAFWIAIAIGLYFLLRAYWQDRRASGVWKTLVQFLREWWRGLWKWLAGWRAALNLRWPERPARPALEPLTAPGWLQRWRARTPQERVRRLYLALVERAAQAGWARTSSQTPYEYVTRLTPHVSGEEQDLSMLTQAFVEARYSRRDFETREIGVLRQVWGRLRNRLRRSG